MSTLIAAAIPNVKATHPLFQQRGYTGYTHCAPNSLGIHGRAHVRQLAYDGYYRNIDIFIASTNKGRKMPTHEVNGVIDMNRISVFLPIIPPAVAIIPTAHMTPADEEKFLAKVAEQDPVKVKNGNTTVFVLNKPRIQKAMTYHRISKDVLSPPGSSVSTAVFAAFSFTISVITEFLKTNTYPAFLTDMDESDHDYASLNFKANEEHDVEISAEEGFFKRPKLEVDEDQDETAVDKDVEMSDEKEERTLIDFSTLRSAVFTAKPSPVPLEHNVGEPSEVPHMPGRCFPYFDKMYVPDNNTIRTIMSTFFIRNMGENREEQVAQFKAFRKGWEDLAKTKVGGEIVHLLMGVRLALETQTRMFVVFRSGEYVGFCLLGARWSVTIQDRTYSSVPAEELRDAVNKLSSHSYAVDQIAGILSECSLIAHGAELPAKAVTREDLSTAVGMWAAIRARKLDGEKTTRLASVIGMLAYTRTYREVNADSLAWLFGQLALEDANAPDVPEGMPLYIPSNFHLYHDRRFQLLCTFGPNAPSLNNTRGSGYFIPPSPEDDPNNKLDNKGRKTLPHLLVALKGVGEAYSDLNRVLSERSIFMDIGERAAKNRNVMLARDSRDKVYEAMRACFNARDEQSKKRLAENAVAGPSTKRAKAMDLSSAKDLLDLL